MKPFARIVLSPVLAVLTGSCRVMFRMAVIVGLLCNGCATIPEHPSTSIGKCAQDMRIFDVRLADKVVDATSYEEVEGILGLPTNNFGSGIVHNQWVFDNGEVYEINSWSEREQQGKKQPVGIMFPCWRVKRQKANADTGRCVVATVEITSEKRPNMSYKIDVWPVGHPNAFLSVEGGTNLVLDRESFLGSGLEKVEEYVRVRVRRTDCHGVEGVSFHKTFVISKTEERQCEVMFAVERWGQSPKTPPCERHPRSSSDCARSRKPPMGGETADENVRREKTSDFVEFHRM